MMSSEFEIRALLEVRAEACQVKDVDRLLRLYAPDVVYYDVVPPMRFAGLDEVRGNFVRWFDEYDGPIALETRELVVAAGGEAAFAHMLHLDSGRRGNGLRTSIWVRSSLGLRRTEQGWLITHEHVSAPIDPATLQAWFPPDGEPV
ncbi:nuclear transport factor 2 family protein [Nonomuraea sp. NPDC005692]|uniref:YybH family protein n=1 Tax=Nonomuraea sp. NPDC005692 TaxID=3157168 RepID=UPI0033C5EAD4